MRDTLPPALAALEADRRRVTTLLGELQTAGDPAERADLAGELVHFAARYEDVKDRAVYPVLDRAVPGSEELARARCDHEAVRDALAAVRARTRHVTPRNARVDDPEGFDAGLDELTRSLGAHLEHEDAEILPLVERLGPADAEALAAAAGDAADHAVAHPRPPRNRLARAVVGLSERLDRRVEDAPTPGHAAPTRDEPG